MDDSTFLRLRHLFDSLVALRPEERRAAVAQRDDLDERTKQRLADLLSIDARMAGLAARSVIPIATTDAPLRLGTRACVVEAPLGEGGTAGDAPAPYRLGRFARRHRIAPATGLLFVAVMAVGIATWLRQYAATLAERDRAERVTRAMSARSTRRHRRACTKRKSLRANCSIRSDGSRSPIARNDGARRACDSRRPSRACATIWASPSPHWPCSISRSLTCPSCPTPCATTSRQRATMPASRPATSTRGRAHRTPCRRSARHRGTLALAIARGDDQLLSR